MADLTLDELLTLRADYYRRGILEWRFANRYVRYADISELNAAIAQKQTEQATATGGTRAYVTFNRPQ